MFYRNILLVRRSVGLSRKEVKNGIMNKPYSAKDRTLAQYIKDYLILYKLEEIYLKLYLI